MTEIPDVYMDLRLEKKAFAHVATVMPDGSPQNTPVRQPLGEDRSITNSDREDTSKIDTRNQRM